MLRTVLPRFRNLRKVERVLPFNTSHLVCSGIGIMLVPDENGEEDAVLALLADHSMARGKVVVSDKAHP